MLQELWMANVCAPPQNRRQHTNCANNTVWESCLGNFLNSKCSWGHTPHSKSFKSRTAPTPNSRILYRTQQVCFLKRNTWGSQQKVELNTQLHPYELMSQNSRGHWCRQGSEWPWAGTLVPTPGWRPQWGLTPGKWPDSDRWLRAASWESWPRWDKSTRQTPSRVSKSLCLSSFVHMKGSPLRN